MPKDTCAGRLTTQREWQFELLVPGTEINTASRLIDLNKIKVNSPVQNIKRFLCLLRKFPNIVKLEFACAQPQALFDRLPDHGVVQKLTIKCNLSDLEFISRLSNLLRIKVNCSISPINAQTLRKNSGRARVSHSFQNRVP